MGTKHRGITKDTREWVYGEKITVGDRVFITCENLRELIGIDCSEGLVRLRIDCHEIIPETLGVFIHKRIDGVEFYEGDTVNYESSKYDEDTGERFYYDGVIESWRGQAGIGFRYRSASFTMMLKIGHLLSMHITGTIHDHLLNEKKDMCKHKNRVWTIDPYDQKCHKCKNCGEYNV